MTVNTNEILRHFGGTSINDLNRLLDSNDDNIHEISTESFSPYKTSDQIIKYFGMNKDFCLMDLNCQSINAKFDKLKSMLLFFKQNNFNINALCLQETWISGD